MLSGPELGAAIRKAISLKKGCSQAELARHFKVKPPSVNEWLKYGRIDKDKINELVTYFSDVVGPEHWGLKLPKGPSPASKSKDPAWVPELTPAQRKLDRFMRITIATLTDKQANAILHMVEQVVAGKEPAQAAKALK